MSYNVVYTDEAINEVTDLLNSKKYYLDFTGNLTHSVATDTIKYVVQNLTGFRK